MEKWLKNLGKTSINITPLNISCPICNKNKLKLVHSVTPVPYYGKIFLMTIKCDECKFKVSDIMAVMHHEKKIHRRKICQETINDLVVLSSGSKVEIPELGIETIIKTEEGGEITTIEGILFEFISFSKQMYINLTDEESKKIVEGIIKRLEMERVNPSCELTLKIVDETGKSTIIPHNAWIKSIEQRREEVKVEREELENLVREAIKKFVKEKNQ